MGAMKIAQWLRALSALPGKSAWILNTHTVVNCNSTSKLSAALPRTLRELLNCYTQTYKTDLLFHIKKIKFKIKNVVCIVFNNLYMLFKNFFHKL